jgi:putative nucleotidyltransferase with HDIG domain
MFGSGHKRNRPSRAVAVRGPETAWSRLVERLQDRRTLLRLGLCLGALLMLLVAVQSWQAPFPYRVGYFAPHGIAAKIDFERVDEQETDRLRRQAEDQVPLVMLNRPELLDLLPRELSAALGEIAQATSIAGDEESALSEETAIAFGLSPPTGELLRRERVQSATTLYGTDDPDTRFLGLKQVLGGMEMGTRKIEDIVDDFTKFLAPLRKYGIIDPRDMRREDLKLHQSDRRLRIVTEGVELAPDVLPPQVRLSEQLNDAGDLGKSWVRYPSLTAELRPALSHRLLVSAKSTLQYEDVATTALRQAARDDVPDVMQRFLKGDVLVQPGEIVDEDKLRLLENEYEAAERLVSGSGRLARMGVVFLMMVVLAVVNGYYLVHNEPQVVRSLPRLTTYLMTIVGAALLGRWLSFVPWPAEVMPLIAAAMILAVAYNQTLATVTAFTLCVIVTLSTTSELSQFLVLMSTTAMAVIPLSRVASRSKIVVVGLYTAATYLLVSCGIAIIQTQGLAEVFHDWTFLAHAAKGAALCLFTGYLVAGTLPFVEKTFDIVTDMSLLELSDPSHPLLQELVRRAPGTYNHSITVGSIAEAAAERIGGNGLLVRVGAYFHDIGKMLKPQYFIENIQEGAENRHAHLAPAMSTLIIIGHVKDGVDLAQQHNLPQQIIDFIEQHHGTTLVEYFYHEATKLAEGQPDHRTDAEESSFRYPGPKPQTREAGVLMLADAVESASRTLSDPTPKRIESLVHALTLKRLLDGQFDDCSLKLSEIRTIEDSLVKSLIAIYHGRIRYPEARTA